MEQIRNERIVSKTERKVVVAMDGSKEADYAFDIYMKHVHKDRDEVILMHCVQFRPEQSYGSLWMPLNPEAIFEEYKHNENNSTEICRKLRDLIDKMKAGGKVWLMKIVGDPGPSIVAKSNECNASLIVVGSRGLGIIRRTILGSVSDYVLHHSNVPVIVCRQ